MTLLGRIQSLLIVIFDGETIGFASFRLVSFHERKLRKLRAITINKLHFGLGFFPRWNGENRD